MTSPIQQMRVRPLTAALVAETARMLGRAFEVDPAYRYLIADARRREKGLTDFFARNLRVHLPHRCTFVALDDGDRVAATVTVRPPEGIHISSLTMLRRGLLPFALAHGRQPVKRLFWLKKTYEALEAEAANGRPHGYVHMMAVSPERQGRGLGGWLLREVLLMRGQQDGSVPIVLTTHLERNVVFYRRAGFRVLSERVLEPPGGTPYPVWSMGSATNAALVSPAA
jgi:ribosomal protein S18 acetylase RimI-like enzyme